MSIDESCLGGECCDACESYVHDPRRQQYSLRNVSLRLRSGEDGLVYVVKAEAATACAKSDAKNDQKRSEGHPNDGEEREPVPALNMVTVFQPEIHVGGFGCVVVLLALLEVVEERWVSCCRRVSCSWRKAGTLE